MKSFMIGMLFVLNLSGCKEVQSGNKERQLPVVICEEFIKIKERPQYSGTVISKCIIEGNTCYYIEQGRRGGLSCVRNNRY